MERCRGKQEENRTEAKWRYKKKLNTTRSLILVLRRIYQSQVWSGCCNVSVFIKEQVILQGRAGASAGGAVPLPTAMVEAEASGTWKYISSALSLPYSSYLQVILQHLFIYYVLVCVCLVYWGELCSASDFIVQMSVVLFLGFVFLPVFQLLQFLF